jgi:PTS system beta-glucosides-specific IIC component
MGVAIAVSFLLTVLVGFKEPDEHETKASTDSNDVQVFSPLDGTVLALREVPDQAFADGSLGAGVAIRPRSGAVYAPFDGVVVAAFPTGHAVGLRHANGTELLIHVGIDTVKLAGEHFTLKVVTGQEVKAGDLLVEFDRDAIAAAGYDLITPVIVTNVDLYPEVATAAGGPIAHGDPLFVAVALDTLAASE